MKYKFLIFFLLWIVFFIPVHAADLESPRFRIESASVDLNEPDSNTDTPSKDIPKDKEVQQFEDSGLVIKTDELSTSSNPFKFQLDKSLIQIDDIKPAIPGTDSTTLRISGGRSTYQVTLSESDSPKKLSGDTIADTKCDEDTNCNPEIANIWNSVSAYGFGYSLKGSNIPEDFKGEDYFRPFANSKKNISPTLIMNGNTSNNQIQATLTIKTLVSAVQADGSYDNVITITASPGY